MSIFSEYQKKHEFLICVDSDGCAMDTMDIKHIQCFGPCMVQEWNLEPWQEAILRRWNEINLYTITRGINRFKALAMALEEINRQYAPIEDLKSLTEWAANAKELSNAAVEKAAKEQGSICLAKALSWSKAVNESITQLPEAFKKPFEGVGEALKAAKERADVAIVSSANPEAVLEEWGKYGLLESVDIVLAQNAGSKAFCIGEMLKQGYDKDHVLMIGDAPGDEQAAKKNDVLFYPILVRHEKESWEMFRETILDEFIEGTYTGEKESRQRERFVENLS